MTEEYPKILEPGPNAYSVPVIGDTMAPRYAPGMALIVDPDRPLAVGCCALVVAHWPYGGDSGELGEIVDMNDTAIVLHQYKPPRDILIARSDVVSADRVVGAVEAERAEDRAG